MDATNLHMQTLKANKVNVGEKIKICLFSTASKASEGGAFVEQPFGVCFLYWGGETSRS